MGASEPAPHISHRPQIAVVLLACREKEIFAVRGPGSGRLPRRLIPTRQDRVRIVSICGCLPNGLRPVFIEVNREPNVSAVRRPRRRARISVGMKQLAELRSIATNRVQIVAAYENNLHSVRRPRGIVTGGFSETSWLATLHGPEPERHFFIAARKLSDQKLRVVGGHREESRILERCRDLLRVTTFHGSLHQVPVTSVALQKEDPRTVRNDTAPLVDSAIVGYPVHALYAGARHGINDEKQQPGTE